MAIRLAARSLEEVPNMVTIAPSPPASGVRAHGLPPGARAPELGLPATPDGRRVTLGEHQGSPVVLIFYPGDFTPVCTSELGLFNELLPELGSFGAKIFAVSCDSLWSHIAYAMELNLQIPLLSDFHPKGEVSRRYDVYRDDVGISERALFVVDGRGVIFWSHVSPLEVNPGADAVLDALEQVTGKQLQLETATPQRPQPHTEARP
jgi:peroxiredoxin